MFILRMSGLFVFVLVCLFIIAGCDEDKVVEGIFSPVSEESFEGLWRGGLTEGSIILDSPPAGERTQDRVFTDMYCTLVFRDSTFELEFEHKPGNTPTTYALLGEWTWDEEDPEKLMFASDSVWLEQKYNNGTGGTTTIWSGDTVLTTWSCTLEFLGDDFKSMRLYGFDNNLSWSEWGDSTVFLFAKP